MTTVRPRSEPVLNDKWAAFIQGGVAITVASRDSQNVPTLVRGLGCRVSGDSQRVMVLVAGSQGDPLTKAIRSTSTIAAVFTQPSTHRTIQLKGIDAAAVRTGPTDLAFAREHREKWIQELLQIGYTREFSAAIWGPPSPALAAIAFTATSAFQQTPGPAAGQPLVR